MTTMLQPTSMFPEHPYPQRQILWRWVWRIDHDRATLVREWIAFPRFPCPEDMPDHPERQHWN